MCGAYRECLVACSLLAYPVSRAKTTMLFQSRCGMMVACLIIGLVATIMNILQYSGNTPYPSYLAKAGHNLCHTHLLVLLLSMHKHKRKIHNRCFCNQVKIKCL